MIVLINYEIFRNDMKGNVFFGKENWGFDFGVDMKGFV